MHDAARYGYYLLELAMIVLDFLKGGFAAAADRPVDRDLTAHESIAKPKCESERKIFERMAMRGPVRSPHVPRRRVNSAMPAPTMAADSYACTYGVHIQQHHSPTRPYLFPYPVLRPGASATSTAHHMQYMLCCCCW